MQVTAVKSKLKASVAVQCIYVWRHFDSVVHKDRSGEGILHTRRTRRREALGRVAQLTWEAILSSLLIRMVNDDGSEGQRGTRCEN